MSDHPIEGMMNTTLEKIKEMVDINTIVGDPITSPDGSIIIPVSKISYGFASGGSDFPTKVRRTKNSLAAAQELAFRLVRLLLLPSVMEVLRCFRLTHITILRTELSVCFQK